MTVINKGGFENNLEHFARAFIAEALGLDALDIFGVEKLFGVITEYLEELSCRRMVGDSLGNLKSVAAAEYEGMIILLIFIKFRIGNDRDALFAEIYAVVYIFMVGMESYRPLCAEERLTVCQCLYAVEAHL